MPPLTDTQHAILDVAAQRGDRLAAPPAHLPPAPRIAVAKAMLKAGLLAHAGVAAPHDLPLAWKLDGETVLLRATSAGLVAMGVVLDDTATAAQGTPLTAPDDAQGHETCVLAEAAMGGRTGQQEPLAAKSSHLFEEAPTDAHTAPLEAVCGRVGTDAPPRAEAAQAASTGQQRPSLRKAGMALLVAWDTPDRPRLDDAVQALRAAMPAPRARHKPGVPRGPRSDTKQAAVLALLRRPEGASGPDIAAATGWQPHTVRGFVAGLKKRGTAVVAHERVRQAGAGKDGTKGSFTIYRIAPEAEG